MGNGVTIALVAAYFVLCICLALFMEWQSKKKKLSETAEGFTTAKNTMGVLAVFGLIVGNNIGGSYILGTPPGIVGTNLGYLWTVIGYGIGYGLAVFYHRYYRAASFKYETSTIGQTFTAYFSSRVAKVVTITLFVAYAASVSATLGTIGVILRNLFGMGYASSIAFTIAILVVMALFGGLGGLSRINFVHVIFMLGAPFIIAILCVATVPGGWSSAWADYVAAGKATFSGGIYGVDQILPLIFIQPFACFASGLIITGAIGAKDAKTARTAQLMQPAFSLLLFPTLVVVGVCAMAFGIAADNNMWYTVSERFGPVVTALACVGVLAGGLSSAPPMIMMMGTTIVREFIVPMSKKEIDDKRQIFLTRVFMVICGIVFPLLGVFSSDLIRIISNAFSIWAVTGLALTLHLIWKRPDENVMFWSMLCGAIVCTIWIFAGFFVEGGMLFGIPTQTMAFLSTVVVYVIMTFATTKPGPSENYLRYDTAKKEMLAAGKD